MLKNASTLLKYPADRVIIGGGVIGLAVASRLSKEKGTTLLLEKHSFCGEETSSRNSEVIHAGLYYPPDSLKTELCIQGNKLLYKHCAKYQIPHSKITKWIVAQDDDEAEYLLNMKNKCDQLGQPLNFLPSNKITELEPNISAKEVLVSPETGIIDSHSLMDQLEDSFTENDGLLATNSKVQGIEVVSGGYEVRIDDCIIKTPIVINCAGLYADRVYAFLKPNHDLTIYPLKGQYFGYRGKKLASRLVYPVPPKGLQILGIHLTLDLGGRMKFGPDCEDDFEKNRDPFNYKVDDSEQRRDKFYQAIKRYLPAVEKENFFPDYAGIRPKLSIKEFKDFVIREESNFGLPGFVNVVGIDSPGLTCSLAIANKVANLLGYTNEGDF